MILIYDFGYGSAISHRVLKIIKESSEIVALEKQNKLQTFSLGIGSTQFKRIQGLLKKIEEIEPNYILGMGIYRKDGKFLRVEKKFINKRGGKLINPQGPGTIYSNSSFIEDSKQFNKTNFPVCEASFAGNGPCNFSAYSILNKLEEIKLKSEFTFLHIPQGFNAEKTAKLIIEVIKSKS